MVGSILGTRVRRTEDPELLDGSAHFISDMAPEGMLHVAFVRSEMAHARIERIDTDEARRAAGVVAVHTAADLPLRTHHGMIKVHDDFARAPLATGVVRFVGEIVAVIVAETERAAHDALDLVVVDYDPLDVVVDPEEALAGGAPVLFEHHGDNVASSSIDPAADVLAEAEVVVRGRYRNQRMAIAAIETHNLLVVPGDDGSVVMHAATQNPHNLRRLMLQAVDIEPGKLRVIAGRMGGGFGGKSGIYSEQIVVVELARLLGRPLTWRATRREDMVTLHHSRAQIQYVELGCRRDGTFTGLRVRLVGDAGAYPTVGTYLPAGTKRMSNGPYAFPKLRFDVVVATTNTTPTGAYRGAGRPEATALLERAVDHAALELGIDPIEIRRRNFIADDAFPYKTLTGMTYDTGRYMLPLERAAEIAGYDALRLEQAARRAHGDRMLLGIGVASYVEVTAGAGGGEFGKVEVHPDGSATVRAGTSAHGQGHQTAYAMIVSEQTGIPIERIRLAAGDTDSTPTGGGTGGSRSLQLGGSAVWKATEAMVVKAKALAGHLLEADVADIVVDREAGALGVAGVPSSSITWGELARRAGEAPEGVVDASDGAEGLAAQLDFSQGTPTYPFGAHISVVEVDRETGQVRLLRHVAVDDCGTVLNPVLVEGQQQGGVAAGVAQALYEHVLYDSEGNPLTANFADYGIASAAEFPSFEVSSTETPTPHNPLGAKGIGEASTIGSTPAVQNAVIDAVAHLGVRHIDLPCTAEAVWRAIRAAEAGAPIDPWREPPEIFDRLSGDTVDKESLTEAEGV